MKSTIKIRLNVVAEQASDIITKLMDEGIITTLDDIVMSGFCTGAHIAAYTCRILEKKYKQKVKAAFGKLRFVTLSVCLKRLMISN